ncbi:DUF2911 domain-containing protein [Cyclobacterium jeungdonense]|uniref:DUF2911 domain-containing protein n=1 Tax=Cyclobacterium jeungdonense TaxID=708087 RepID=A0ABT8CAV5_9BACT|nr:DUF2911 domain-containing protein [Cyclobacterium jeungdonense]MDN3689526.1 DUF2911 domain-containing protein [Cyclobacterium jeungdonense]
MKNSRFLTVATAFTIMLVFSAFYQSHAQIQAPAPSPAASVSQNVGFTTISIDYSSPGVKGRMVFGDLVPYGVPWRAGANAPTTIEFSTAVSVGGTTLGPGKYTVFITPAVSGDWTLHFNSKGNAIYAYMEGDTVDTAALSKDDAVAISVSPLLTGKQKERLSYTISAADNKVAEVVFEWDDVMFSFKVDTQVDQKMESFKAAFN